jgi:catechol 2,3-dioxygenase-like lactoylglutathione lyase family enzyme
MKRFHVHLHVQDLARNVDFYSRMFGARPTRVEDDYAKWMLDEPAVNFAISARGPGAPGLDHLGIQVDSDADLTALNAQAQAAGMALIDEGATTCCYARSDKHWIIDPQGVPWEHFRTLGTIPTFNEAAARPGASASQPAEPVAAQAGACCAPPAAASGCASAARPAGSSCC